MSAVLFLIAGVLFVLAAFGIGLSGVSLPLIAAALVAFAWALGHWPSNWPGRG
jgi:hypothetical protein